MCENVKNTVESEVNNVNDTTNDIVGHKILADAIMFILRNDTISIGSLINRFRFNPEIAFSIISAFKGTLIGEEIDNGLFEVIVKKFDDINKELVEILNENGFTNDDINLALTDISINDKEEISNILMEEREWVSSDNKPDVDIPVIIRIVNKNIIYYKNHNEVMYAEDMKIGKWDGTIWSILPPYPRYDYSPLSKFGELSSGTVVTHWAEPLNDEFEGWNSRFDRLTDHYLNIEVAPEYEEDVYRALMWGAAYISKFGGKEFASAPAGTGLRLIYDTLCDMQASMDLAPKSKIEERNIPMEVIHSVDFIIECATEESTNGQYSFKWERLREKFFKSNEAFNDFFLDIISELCSRDEIFDIDINYAEGAFEFSIDVSYCRNYEWSEGDEEIFECTKEEWEKREPKSITKKGDL